MQHLKRDNIIYLGLNEEQLVDYFLKVTSVWEFIIKKHQRAEDFELIRETFEKNQTGIELLHLEHITKLHEELSWPHFFCTNLAWYLKTKYTIKEPKKIFNKQSILSYSLDPNLINEEQESIMQIIKQRYGKSAQLSSDGKHIQVPINYSLGSFWDLFFYDPGIKHIPLSLIQKFLEENGLSVKLLQEAASFSELFQYIDCTDWREQARMTAECLQFKFDEKKLTLA